MPSGGRAGAAASGGRARQGGGGVAVWRRTVHHPRRVALAWMDARRDADDPPRANLLGRRRAIGHPETVALVPRERGAQPLAPDVPPARRVGAQRGEVAVAEPAATRARVSMGRRSQGAGPRARAAARRTAAASRRCTGSTSQNTAGRSRARTSTRSSSSNATPSRGRAA